MKKKKFLVNPEYNELEEEMFFASCKSCAKDIDCIILDDAGNLKDYSQQQIISVLEEYFAIN